MSENLTEQGVWEDLDEYCRTLRKGALIEAEAMSDMLLALYEIDEDDAETRVKVKLWVKSWVDKGGVVP